MRVCADNLKPELRMWIEEEEEKNCVCSSDIKDGAGPSGRAV
jgi:hypothetical protein